MNLAVRTLLFSPVLLSQAQMFVLVAGRLAGASSNIDRYAASQSRGVLGWSCGQRDKGALAAWNGAGYETSIVGLRYLW